ncbi:DUF4169 family protein [Phyllobacterium zundukense]|uniref:DUF4169 domain-containing protein n=1 Tax=Phyllobacterium zundukense TaxID=1867719 RepID=A0A2N9W2K2_9HYPH|nr:DUF4169 family protein [Phyllobacterium zundukense]ATU91064.1 hypothetical protein BLM14_05025 [Phyllobacterium zundukense]PIO45970.1 hypothetical protein B5P45_05415 [Phyllobacterium zundukense]
MAEIVNLRLVKKRKAKDAREKSAAENRILFGRTKVEKQFEREAARKDKRFLDDNRIEKRDMTRPTESDADGK